MPAGYSGTPLSKKLGIKSGGNLVAWDAPRNYLKLLAPLPKEVTLASRLGQGTDILHVFCTKRTTLNAALFQLSDQKTFVTFAYALIDRDDRSIRYATK